MMKVGSHAIGPPDCRAFQGLKGVSQGLDPATESLRE
jgi:hypothetical protein